MTNGLLAALINISTNLIVSSFDPSPGPIAIASAQSNRWIISSQFFEEKYPTFSSSQVIVIPSVIFFS